MIPLGILGSSRVGASGLTPTYRGAAFKIAPSLASKTYAAVPIGTASATRTVLVIATAWSGGSRAISSCTIGGVTATLDYTSGTPACQHFTAWRAAVPTGTTADVVIVCSDSTPDVSVGVWTVDAALAVQSSAYTSISIGATSGTVTAPSTNARGFCIAGFSARSEAFSTTWTNVTERYDNSVAQPSSAGDAATVGGSLAITVAFSAAVTNDPVRLGVVAYKPA